MRSWSETMRGLTRRTALFVLCVVMAGCTAVSPREETGLKPATAEELTTLLRQREAAIQTMKGLFSAKVRGGLLPISTRIEGAVYYQIGRAHV